MGRIIIVLYIFCLMKSRFRIHLLIVLISLLAITTNNLSCSAPFTELPYATGTYCAKCDVTCKTCSGTSINSCSSCPTSFTLDSTTGTCVAPATGAIETIASVYHTYGFQMETSIWSGGSGVDSTCGIISVLKAAGTAVISSAWTLTVHY